MIPDNDYSAAIWPNPIQKKVLEAALLKGGFAWEAWLAIKPEIERSHHDFATEDFAIEELFPLVYCNLTKQGFADPELDKLKRFSMLAWTRNQLRFQNLEKILKAFQSAQIDTVVLKGAAFIPLYYRDKRARGMGDVDLLVAEKDFLPASEILEGLGWNSLFSMKSFDQRFNKSMDFVEPAGFAIDLHHRIFHASGGASSLWDASVSQRIGDINTRTLSATDHLLHICAHGLIMGHYSPIRWIADANKLFEVASEKIDWERLFRLSNEGGLQLQLKLALNYLQKEFNSPVPTDILSRLSDCQIRPVDRCFAKNSMEFRRGKPFKMIMFHWSCYRKIIEIDGLVNHFHFFPKYMKSVLQRDHPLQILSQLIIKVFCNICYRLGIDCYKN